ncbi:hypothetical protein STEG23_028122 [Scotinomys teguina]
MDQGMEQPLETEEEGAMDQGMEHPLETEEKGAMDQGMEHPPETEKSKQKIIKEPLAGSYSNGPIIDFCQ